MMKAIQNMQDSIIRPGNCTGCGACVAVCRANSFMKNTPQGPVPHFEVEEIGELALRSCPAYRLSYPQLYRDHFGHVPSSGLLGHCICVRVGYAQDADIRRRGASGGILTATLCYLLESGRVDAVIAVRQGIPEPETARAVICKTVDEIRECAQSVYVPVSVLDILKRLEPNLRYAMTCLPDQSAALRALQREGFAPALQIRYVVGPYTGTALYPAAISHYLRSHGVAADDPVVSLAWRAGEWPGYLEIKTASGRCLRSKKVYYNYLIPFFITRNSTQNMDFANEFADLAVGDAWSPAYEEKGEGYAVFTTRTEEMESVIQKMIDQGIVLAECIDPLKAAEMHGHMLDFKKRGGYIRNRIRRFFGCAAPDFGMRPFPLPFSRVATEVVIFSIISICSTRVARLLLRLIPERWVGPVFDRLRLGWKRISKPTKRKGLAELVMIEDVREKSL
jgi:coenzyme F420 hydrogenase subunit beta